MIVFFLKTNDKSKPLLFINKYIILKYHSIIIEIRTKSIKPHFPLKPPIYHISSPCGEGIYKKNQPYISKTTIKIKFFFL